VPADSNRTSPNRLILERVRATYQIVVPVEADHPHVRIRSHRRTQHFGCVARRIGWVVPLEARDGGGGEVVLAVADVFQTALDIILKAGDVGALGGAGRGIRSVRAT
jgi:hypothetical protein